MQRVKHPRIVVVAGGLAVIGMITGCFEQSVKPGINDEFKAPDVQKWAERFEAESREVFREREKVVAACDIRPGMAVADIGAGTGFFTMMFSAAVGETGRVYAVDIAREFLKRIDELARQQGRKNVVTVQAGVRSVNLQANSIDVAFICDTYHHFEYPHSTMRSIYRALRPGGILVIVDFQRIDGKSRQWVLDHVRAGKETVIKEVRAERFELVDEPPTPFFEENYILRFRKGR